MKTEQNLPSRFWHIERNQMYVVTGRYGTKVEIVVNDGITLMVDESEGDRMDWTGRRDSEGNDVYELDVIKHVETGEICLVHKLTDPIRTTECMTCLIREDAVIECLPFEMKNYTRLGDYYRDNALVPDKLKNK